MEWLAPIVGIDAKTQTLLSGVGISVFVALAVVGSILAIGDISKVAYHYIRDWRNGHDTE